MGRLKEALRILLSGEETYTSNDPEVPQAASTQLLIVPVEANQRPEQISKEVRDSVLSLRFHPGFQYLTQKFRFQRQVVEAKLKSEKHTSLREVDLLQSMIGALSWHEQQIDQELSRSKPVAASPTLSEQQLFEQVQKSIELI